LLPTCMTWIVRMHFFTRIIFNSDPVKRRRIFKQGICPFSFLRCSLNLGILSFLLCDAKCKCGGSEPPLHRPCLNAGAVSCRQIKGFNWGSSKSGNRFLRRTAGHSLLFSTLSTVYTGCSIYLQSNISKFSPQQLSLTNIHICIFPTNAEWFLRMCHALIKEGKIIKIKYKKWYYPQMAASDNNNYDVLKG
jgi:hypothetical protein